MGAKDTRGGAGFDPTGRKLFVAGFKDGVRAGEGTLDDGAALVTGLLTGLFVLSVVELGVTFVGMLLLVVVPGGAAGLATKVFFTLDRSEETRA